MQLKSDFLGIAATVVSLFAPLAHADEVSCKTVRFADLGWSDISTTADLASVALEGSGYKATLTLLKNLQFTTDIENAVMLGILDKAKPNKVAKAFLKKNPELLDGRLEGVKTFSGQECLPTVIAALK